MVPEDDPFLSVVERFHAVRQKVAPKTASADGRGTSVKSVSSLERVSTVLQIPLKAEREVERIALTDKSVAVLFDDLESQGEIRYKYLVVVIDEPTGAIVCAVAVGERQKVGGRNIAG